MKDSQEHTQGRDRIGRHPDALAGPGDERGDAEECANRMSAAEEMDG